MAEKDRVAPVLLADREFVALPLAEKKDYLKKMDAKTRLDLIIADPDARRLTASLEPQEFMQLVKEVGESDALELFRFASAEQCVFVLDMESWHGYEFSEGDAFRWLTYFLEAGEAAAHQILRRLDFEFLLLFLSRELTVGGGIGDLGHDEERFEQYDFTFDDIFMLSFKHPEHSEMVGSLLKLMIKLDHPLYVALMEAVKGSVDIELEEQEYRFRNARLQDLGFPPLEEAISIYARVNPATFRLLGDKELLTPAEGGQLIPFAVARETLLFRALSHVESQTVSDELNYLVNCALVTEGSDLPDLEGATQVRDRVCGYLNIALEHLSKGDEESAARMLEGEALKRLFQLGFSIVLGLKSAAQQVESTDYASGKALAGLRANRPRYYRGFDQDGIDGYREFKDTEDIRRAARFLSGLAG